jgi:katanin p80 WD40 repeat-containing subunit B1
MSKRNVKIQDFDVGGNLPGSLKTTCAQLGTKSFKVVVSGDDMKNVVLWKLTKSNPLLVFQGHTSDITTVAFSTNEDEVYSGSFGGTVLVWDLNTKKAVSSLKGHMSACTAIAPFANASMPYLATGSADHNVKVWDLRRKGCIQTFKGHTNSVTCVQFSPDNRWVASSAEDGVIRIWDLTASRKLAEMSMGGTAVTCFRFNPQNLTIASGYQDRTVKYWDLENFVHVASTQTESTPIQAISFEPQEGSILFSASHESLKVWNIEQGSLIDNIESSWRGVQDMGVCVRDSTLVGVSVQGNSFSAWATDLNTIDYSGERVEEQKVPAVASRRKAAAVQMSASFIPSDRSAPIDLDPREFLPKPQSSFDARSFEEIRQNHEPIVTLLRRKQDNLNLVMNWFKSGNLTAAVNSLKMMNDMQVTVDVLGYWIAEGTLDNLTLEHCRQIIPLAMQCIESKYENYIRVGALSATKLLTQFNGVISSSITAPASMGVDISREERLKKCEAAYNSFVELRQSTALEKNSKRDNKTGEIVKELVRQLDAFSWSCNRS